MNSHDFLDSVCGEIKYKSVHESVKQELNSHIEDGMEYYMEKGFSRSDAMSFAVSHMGDPREIGIMLDREYRLPFNSRFGLAVWAAIVTVIIYAVYPLLYSLYTGGAIKSPYVDFLILGIISAFMALNVLYLRRGRKIIRVRDMVQITVGFMSGWLAAALVLVYTSYLNIPMCYAYMPDVWLPYAPPYLPLLPKTPLVFVLEGFSWWLCLIIYIIAVKSRRNEPFVITMYYTGMWNDFVAGKPVIFMGSPIMGQRLDKYGEITTPFERSNKRTQYGKH